MKRVLSPLRSSCFLALLVVSALAADPARAQPFGLYLTFDGAPANNAYYQVPNAPALNPSSALTIEMWVNIRGTTAGCKSLIGKDYRTAYWLGVCNGVLRAYFRGGVLHDAGIVPTNQWTHIAVTYDGAFEKHYINGELIFSFPVSGPPGSNTSAVRIGGDVTFQLPPKGEIEEVRLWNVARTVAQIRSTINVALSTAQPGLVAVWPFEAGGADPVGGHNGTLVGESAGVDVTSLFAGSALPCDISTATELCLRDRFSIDAKFRSGAIGTAESTAHTVNVVNPGSGLFWFFSPDTWEVMVKELDGCALNSHHWIFSAATTNVFYRLTVYDAVAFDQKIYFNYPGPPAPAVTDVAAFPNGIGPACP